MIRRVLAAAGCLLIGYAVVGALVDPDARRPGHLVFLGAVLVGHDLVLLPAAIAVGAVAARWLPAPARGPAQAALFASAVLGIVALPLVMGHGRPADDPSTLPRDYRLGLALSLGAVWAVAGAGGAVRLVRARVGTSPGMRQDNYPHPISDAAAEGLPDYADDDSNANEDAQSTRIADGPDPALLPADQPLAVDRFGTTAEEQRQGESLDYKLAREQGDATDVAAVPSADEGDALTADVDAVRGDAALIADTTVIEPNRDSPVSMYDVPDELTDAGAPVGRLVQPDEGVRADTEKDAIAADLGTAGGGPSAEEAAMHEVREP